MGHTSNPVAAETEAGLRLKEKREGRWRKKGEERRGEEKERKKRKGREGDKEKKRELRNLILGSGE